MCRNELKVYLIFAVFSCLLLTVCESTPPPVLLYSLFSWGGIRGNITFSWGGFGTNILAEVSLEYGAEDIPATAKDLTWAVHEMPVTYVGDQRCGDEQIGKRLVDLNEALGNMLMPLTSIQVFETSDGTLSLIGPESIWGRSIRISDGNRTSCANIQGIGEESTYEARFHSPVGGSIWFRTWSWSDLATQLGSSERTGAGTEYLIISDVFDVLGDELQSSEHSWNLYITDILDQQKERTNCNFLTDIYDPSLKKSCDRTGCPEGDLTSKHGKLLVASVRSGSSRKLYHSSGNSMLDVGVRQIYVGIEDVFLNNNVYACARLRRIKAKIASAQFSGGGVVGHIQLEQSSPFSPTQFTLDIHNLQKSANKFGINELRYEPTLANSEEGCSETGELYDPYNVDSSPQPTLATHDEYKVGDLSGKHGVLLDSNSITATVIDQNLPLFGPWSVIGRSVVIYRAYPIGGWVCANLRQNITLARAVAVFRYPLVGEIIMEQEFDDPLADTTVSVGPLLYSDGSHNDTADHKWYVTLNIPEDDIHEWRNRCISAGPHFNPYKVSTTEKVYKSCSWRNPERCEVGDLFRRLGPLSIAGSIESALKMRKVFTDTNLPLSGINTILSHSIIIEDKYNRNRGHRLACTRIDSRQRYKGVVKEWRSGEEGGAGMIEFTQETPYDATNTEIYLMGLKGIASGYHVHMVPVFIDQAFPCSASSLYGHFNPFGVNAAESPNAGSGTDDMYEIGDLSGKYGLLDGKDGLRESYTDTNLPLFGHNSIIGRSVVVHKKERAERWFCGSIEWGYSPSQARQVAAIASFHNPKGFAWGYIRLRQLIYEDGSTSETSIEVNLRHPGDYNKNITRGHNWSVFVQQVGIDATIKPLQSRCTAAGYRWNPYWVQLSAPNDKNYYDKQCTPGFPLRCDAGDLSGRLGPITLGKERTVYMDKNLPLGGENSAVGRAIVIHTEKGGVDKFACANIQPDEDIVKWVNLKKTLRFTMSEFMNEMRKIMGAPTWFLLHDQNSYNEAGDGKCISFKILFMGPLARELERDFSRLLAGGILERPTVNVPGEHPDAKRKQKVNYRSCSGLDDSDNEFGLSSADYTSKLLTLLYLCQLIILRFM